MSYIHAQMMYNMDVYVHAYMRVIVITFGIIFDSVYLSCLFKQKLLNAAHNLNGNVIP